MNIIKKEYYTISEFAEAIDKTRKTLLRWDRKDILKPDRIGENGYRYYTYKQYQNYMKEKFNIDVV